MKRRYGMKRLLSDEFTEVLHALEMEAIKHPVFYNTPIGIRFEIGGNESVYTRTHRPNPLYVSAALKRAAAIYNGLPHLPDILRIDCFPDSGELQEQITAICSSGNLPVPHEQIQKELYMESESGEEAVQQVQLYWDLCQPGFAPEALLKEIIRADIGGNSELVSNVFFANTQDRVLYHLYDDRGADVAAADRETIRSLYLAYHDWILDYDLEKIDEGFR